MRYFLVANLPTRYGTRTRIVICPGTFVGGPGGVPFPVNPPNNEGFRDALIKLKCSAADKISRFALATSSLRPVTTKTGSSPRTGVLI
ncbi:CLUMA_CG020526, isoform A [Clunio marinus]|uniref:CLUMA_CG020526, isoform A n=1 Tax=Clunio marinus TaxID=568069 RepID=A0A1J1J979_9DIPT|nr:CLUMA_CG020526, isoform A [Clunio marinus]